MLLLIVIAFLVLGIGFFLGAFVEKCNWYKVFGYTNPQKAWDEWIIGEEEKGK